MSDCTEAMRSENVGPGGHARGGTTLDDAVYSALVLDAMAQSVETGAWVNVKESDMGR